MDLKEENKSLDSQSKLVTTSKAVKPVPMNLPKNNSGKQKFQKSNLSINVAVGSVYTPPAKFEKDSEAKRSERSSEVGSAEALVLDFITNR